MGDLIHRKKFDQKRRKLVQLLRIICKFETPSYSKIQLYKTQVIRTFAINSNLIYGRDHISFPLFMYIILG